MITMPASCARFLIAIVFTLFLPCGLVLAQSSAAQPTAVGRTSNDRDADLIAELIRRTEFDVAENLILRGLKSTSPMSDAYARWTLWYCELETAQRRTREDFSDQEILAAQKPIRELLDSYPEHPRALFLQSQLIGVETAAAEHDLLAVMIHPADEQRTERALRRLTAADSVLETLATTTFEAKTRLDSHSPTTPEAAAMGSDLARLAQQTQVDLVRVKLMGTELFPRGSDDRLAAATAALQAADEALTQLPSECQARNEVERLRVITLLRSEDFDRARREFNQLVSEVPVASDLRMRALDILIDLRSDRHDEAFRKLDAFYQPSPSQAPLSIDMDLVRLESLLLRDADDRNQGGDWMETIGKRHGAYGRRRAETIAIDVLRSAPSHASSGESPLRMDPGIVAAQGRQYLRDGNPVRAAQLLASAAMAESTPDRAIKRSLESAAAFVAAKQPGDAADILSGVATLKPSGSGAAAAHLQAAILKSQAKVSARELEAMLQTTITTWPDSEQANQAGNWLVKLYTAQQRRVDAAEVATTLGLNDFETAFELWEDAFQSSDEAARIEMMPRLKHAFAKSMDEPSVAERYRHLATYFFDRVDLDDLPPIDPSAAATVSPSEALLRFRISGATAAELQKLAGDKLEMAAARLMKDGRQDTTLRIPIATLIESWPPASANSLEHAERLVWLGRIKEATTAINALAGEPDAPRDLVRQAASLLSRSDNDAAKRISIEWWDRWAAGLPVGSDDWHRAKLESITTLKQLGDVQQAQQRARYILLTNPPKDNALRDQYSSLQR